MLKSLKKLTFQNGNRVGRGISAGQGKTAGRGTKGQKSRSGHNIPRKFEGGQMPFSMRMPKVKGFKSHAAEVTIISLDTISKNFKDGDVVTLAKLEEKKLISKGDKVKVLNNGKLTVAVTFEVPCSKSIVIPKLKTETNPKSNAESPKEETMAKSTAPKVVKKETKTK